MSGEMLSKVSMRSRSSKFAHVWCHLRITLRRGKTESLRNAFGAPLDKFARNRERMCKVLHTGAQARNEGAARLFLIPLRISRIPQAPAFALWLVSGQLRALYLGLTVSELTLNYAD